MLSKPLDHMLLLRAATDVHRMVGSNYLIYLPTRGEGDVGMYIRPTLLSEAALPPDATLLPGTCPTEPSATSVYMNLYEPACSNQNAASSRQFWLQLDVISPCLSQSFVVED
jgi:hypothetical protein